MILIIQGTYKACICEMKKVPEYHKTSQKIQSECVTTLCPF